MSRLAPRALVALASLLLLAALGCGSGGRDAHDIAADFEGPASSATADRLAHDVDLSRAPVAVSIGREPEEHFNAGDQPALEAYLREVLGGMGGDRIHVTQQVVEDTGANTQSLGLTLSIEHEGQTRFVPATLDLLREGRRMIVTRIRVMGSLR